MKCHYPKEAQKPHLVKGKYDKMYNWILCLTIQEQCTQSLLDLEFGIKDDEPKAHRKDIVG